MKVSTFKAQDMREALQLVKQSLGPDAVILSTRRISVRGASGHGSQSMIEVTACPNPATAKAEAPAGRARDERRPTRDNPYQSEGRRYQGEEDVRSRHLSPAEELFARRNPPPEPPPPEERDEAPPSRRPPPRDPLPPPREVAPAPRETAREPPREAAPFDSWHDPLPEPSSPGGSRQDDMENIRSTLANIQERVSNLPDMVADKVNQMPEVPGLDGAGQRRYGWLVMHGVEEAIARQLALAERSARGKGGLVAAFQRILKFRDPLEGEAPKVIALVGPTGVGKTTTLAKMAADLLLNRRRSVGMITLDTFRVGAVAQLETYAKLLQVRLVVARSPMELKAGMLSLARCDYILVDTVGTSPYNERQVASTSELLQVLGEKREVLLCMAGNVRETEQRAIFRRFSSLQPTGLLFTKLDETVTYGGILNVALRAKLPLTVFTDGQRVPENLGWLTAETMAKWFEQSQNGKVK